MRKSNTASNYAIGFGAYYLLRYGLLFYPAIVMMVQFGNLEDDIGLVKGIIATILTIAIIWRLIYVFKTYNSKPALIILLCIYAITLCPFFQYIHWGHTADYISNHPENFDKVPFEGFKWLLFI